MYRPIGIHFWDQFFRVQVNMVVYYGLGKKTQPNSKLKTQENENDFEDKRKETISYIS